MTDAELAKDLAQQVLAMLDLQQEYFRGGRSGETLARSKAAESALRKRCRAIVENHPTQTGLFDEQ